MGVQNRDCIECPFCRDDETGESVRREVRVWNPTIADITLLALGTSASQISLSIISSVQQLGTPEIWEGGAANITTWFMQFRELADCRGASTIHKSVGS